MEAEDAPQAEVQAPQAEVPGGRKRCLAAVRAEAAFKENHKQFEATRVTGLGTEREVSAKRPQGTRSSSEPAPKVARGRARVVGKACSHHGPYTLASCPICNTLTSTRSKYKVPQNVRLDLATPATFPGAREAAVLHAHPEAGSAKSVWDWVLDNELARRA